MQQGFARLPLGDRILNAGQYVRPILAGALAASLVAGLTACQAERERSAQQDAVEYTLRQRTSSQCANLGLLPGSPEFNTCVAKLEGASR